MAFNTSHIGLAMKLAAEGKHTIEICAAVGCSVPTLNTWRKRYGFTVLRKPYSGKKQIGEREERMASMYRQGLTLEQIGEHFKVSRERVRQLLVKAGVASTDGGASVRKRARLEAQSNRRDAAAMTRWGVDYATMKKHRKSGLIAAFVSQRGSAKLRGIEWSLTFPQWLKVWEQSGKLALRGRGEGRYVMSRVKDEGGYVVGNVHIQLSTDNNSQGIAKARLNKATNIGVWCIFPGSTKPWIAKVAKVNLGSFATEEEAVAARNAYIAANPRARYRGRGYTILFDRQGRPHRYQVMVGRTYVGVYKSAEEAIAARAAFDLRQQHAEAAQGGVVSADPSGFDSLNSHGTQFCPREPLNTTQQIGGAL